jgi:lycopene beta-cyclase
VNSIHLHRDARYVVLGSGASGSLLVRALAAAGVQGPIVLVDDGSVPIEGRVWASWRPLAEGQDPAVSASWRRLVIATERGEREHGLLRHRYVAVRGGDLRTVTDSALTAVSGERLAATASSVRDLGDHVVVSTTAGDLRADFVFDSVGLLASESAVADAWMSFEGCEIESERQAFDPDRLRLMDFRVPQQGGVAFLYTQPWTTSRGLVEFTRISGSPDPPPEPFLTKRLDHVLGAGGYRVTHHEAGVLPLRPHLLRPRGPRCLALGAAAGMVKSSTGYGYELMRRDSARIARQLHDGETPSGLRRRTRHRHMDAFFLELARHDPTMLASSLELLFARNSGDLVLRFLNEATTLGEEARVVSSLPVGPFLDAARRSLVHR